MASAQVLEMKNLLLPIPGDKPAGTNLREDRSPVSVYQAIKASRNQARTAEREGVMPDPDRPPPKPDWRPILDKAPKVIAELSKDIEVTAWLTEALVRQHGFAGLRDGFRLARELAEQYWDQLHPQLNEDGVAHRFAALAGLNGVEGEGTLIAPISKIPLILGNNGGPFTRADYKQAGELESITDPDKRSQRLARGAVSMEMLEKSATETPPEFFRTLLDDISECNQEFDRLCAVLDGRCGPDAPPSSAIRTALAECQDVVRAVSKGVLGEGIAESLAGAAAGGGGSAAGDGSGSRRIQDRQEALQSLLRVAQFFKETEPHSPVSYALEQAVRWGRMPLPALLIELIPDQSARESVFKLVGIVADKAPST